MHFFENASPQRFAIRGFSESKRKKTAPVNDFLLTTKDYLLY